MANRRHRPFEELDNPKAEKKNKVTIENRNYAVEMSYYIDKALHKYLLMRNLQYPRGSASGHILQQAEYHENDDGKELDEPLNLRQQI